MDLIKHAQLSDEEFAKTLLSSGDYFPGFYRFTMGDRNVEKGQLTMSGLLAAFLSEKRYTREEWTHYTLERHKVANQRSIERSDMAVYQLLDKQYFSWMMEANTYDIIVMEIDNGPSEIEKDVTYFLMGSLIRFTDDKLLIGYDLLRSEFLFEIRFGYQQARDYINQIYGSAVKDFFLPTDIVASLEFVDGKGELNMSEKTVTRTVLSHPNSVVYASNRDVSKNLPIRWAKDIILTEVVEL
jgi:hypothetical protein